MNPNPTEEAQAKAFGSLKKLINDSPEEWLIRLFEDHTGISFNPDLVAFQIDPHLNVLQQMAAIGSKEAMENLVEIGIGISKFLEDLAGKQSDRVQENVNANKFTHRDMDPNIACRDSYREMSKAVVLLLDASDEDLKKVVNSIDAMRPTPLRLPAATGMFTQRIRRRRRKQEPVVSVDDCPPTGSESDPSLKADFASEAKMIEVDLLFNRLLEHRAQHLARETVRRVLAMSTSWPIVVPSLAHDSNRTANIERRIQELGLGKEHGYNLGRNTPGQEGVRDITNRVFLILNRERTRALTMSQSHRAEYRAYEQGGMMTQPSGLEVDPEKLRLRELQTLNSRTHWQRKASLLPEPAIAHLDQWVEAGMSYLTSLAAQESYNELIRNGQIVRECERQELLNRLEKKCGNCAERIEDAGCPACEALKLDADVQYRDWVQREIRLLEKWEKGVAQAFEHFNWDSYFSGRAADKTFKSVVREKLRNGFKVILKPSESLPGHKRA